MLNIRPPFVVSVAVLIIDIYKSRAVTISDKTPHTFNERFTRYKVTARDVLSTI